MDASLSSSKSRRKRGAAKRPRRKMALQVKMLHTGKTMDVRAGGSDSVLSIKRSVLKEHGVPPTLQRLMYGGHEMVDESTLREEGVTSRTTLHLGLVDRAPSLLVVIVDASARAWIEVGKQAATGAVLGVDRRATFPEFSAALMVFLNAFLLLNRHNQVVVVATCGGDSEFVFSSADEPSVTAHNACSVILSRLSQLFEAAGKGNATAVRAPANLAKALSLGLCYHNRMKSAQPSLGARMLVTCASPDVGDQYVAVMNCIFSAQKAAVPIDACMFSAHHANFLQQAAHLTGGMYHMPAVADHAALAQAFVTQFLPDVASRRFLKAPPQDAVDLRASCFCHKRHVNLAYVCSVCLSVFCDPLPECTTCGTRRPAKRKAALGSGSKKRAAAAKRARS